MVARFSPELSFGLVADDRFVDGNSPPAFPPFCDNNNAAIHGDAGIGGLVLSKEVSKIAFRVNLDRLDKVKVTAGRYTSCPIPLDLLPAMGKDVG